MSKILVVDDEIGIRELLSEILREEGHQVAVSENAAQAREMFMKDRPELVLLDIWMPDIDGVSLLKEWASSGLMTMPVVMMSGHGTIDTAVEATRIGAYSFLEKPVALQKLLSTVSAALRDQSRDSTREPVYVTLGKTEAALNLKRKCEALTKTAAPVLFLEAPGSGADQCASLLKKVNKPWVVISGPQEYETKGEQLVEMSRDGVIFFRDIGTLEKPQQLDLLARWENLKEAGVRVVASSTTRLGGLVSKDQFEIRLYELMSETIVNVPPLKDRIDDVIEISKSVLFEKYPAKSFSVAALNTLRSYDWPANLSQLSAAVLSSAQFSVGEEIGVSDLTPVLENAAREINLEASSWDFDKDYRSAREMFDKQYLEYHLAKEGGNMSRVANQAGIERTHLYRKLKQLGIKTSRKNED
ncbi:MAG TPA: sigma-54-dependent Fis family transcriptional regulator [Betaproteobacteria bacterium]|jgi:two-component system nitrogen regulation response regulator NtrX|nr:sigma-54-dependent Fis family transcriptional regulator [Betaproteobacteria bacterium]